MMISAPAEASMTTAIQIEPRRRVRLGGGLRCGHGAILSSRQAVR